MDAQLCWAVAMTIVVGVLLADRIVCLIADAKASEKAKKGKHGNDVGR